MNEILDKEKIEKSIKIFYKTLLDREHPHFSSGSKNDKIGLFEFSK